MDFRFSSVYHEIDLDDYLSFEKSTYETVIKSKSQSDVYARVLEENFDLARLSWIHGPGFGNLLMLGVIQDMCKRNIRILTLEVVSVYPEKPVESVLSFYSQYNLIGDSKTNTLRGIPLESPNISLIAGKVKKQMDELKSK